MAYYDWKPYIPVAARRAHAEREVKKLSKQGKRIEPVLITGRTIASSFWGEAWCQHLEKFSDFENRLPRGRTYVRNGSVCHLGLEQGRIDALVSGSELYRIEIKIDPLPAAKWQLLREQCTGKIGSALELLQGRLSTEVMQIVTHRDQGLFPQPGEIHMSCSCPDWAALCKHLAAVLYGVGARLDNRPELLFVLRGVDPQELITADLDLTRAAAGTGRRRRLDEEDLAGLFGVEIAEAPLPEPQRPRTGTPPATAPAPAVVQRPPTKPTKAKADTFVPIGAAVLELRTRLGLSKTEFALLVGVTSVTIGNWEKRAGELNLRQVTADSLRQAARMTPANAAAKIAQKKRLSPRQPTGN